MFSLEGPSHGPHAGGKPARLVVLLHGYGANGADLIGLAPPLAPLLPTTVFHSPDAPFPCPGAPGGYQWFGISRLDPQLMEAGVRAAASIAEGFIDEMQARYGLGDGETALIGFSQGTMLALHVGLRRAQPFAGIVGFSGTLAGPQALADEIKSRPPVLLVHGEEDELIPFGMMAAAESVLRGTGVAVESLGVPGLGHGIEQSGLEAAARFLMRVLGGSPR
jgi:phospholipase/carboxylesterase